MKIDSIETPQEMISFLADEYISYLIECHGIGFKLPTPRQWATDAAIDDLFHGIPNWKGDDLMPLWIKLREGKALWRNLEMHFADFESDAQGTVNYFKTLGF